MFTITILLLLPFLVIESTAFCDQLSDNIYVYDYRLFEHLYVQKFKDRKAAFFDNSTYGAHDQNGDLTNDYCKHSLDAIFVDDIKNGIIRNNTFPNADTIFVIPFMLGRNEYHRSNVLPRGGNYSRTNLALEAKILKILKLFPYYKESKVDHFIMGDTWAVYHGFSNIIRGRFERRLESPTVSVGYSTSKTLSMRFANDFCGYTADEPLGIKRPYKFSFIGAIPDILSTSNQTNGTSPTVHNVSQTQTAKQLSMMKAFAKRTHFLESYMRQQHHLNKSFPWAGVPHFIRAVQKGWEGTELRLSKSETYAYLKNSLFTMNFHGDSPTTDRIFNAIDTATIVIALASAKADLLKTLPYTNSIDWESFFIWISDKEFKYDPQKAIVTTIKHVSERELMQRQKFIHEVQDKISLWKNPVVVYENLWISVRKEMNNINDGDKSPPN